MKILKKLSLIHGVLVSIVCFSLTSSNALAVGAAYFPQDTKVNLTIGGNSTNFTITNGSDADSVVVSTSSIAITISSGQSFKITSSERKKLTNDGGFSVACSSTESSITATVTTVKTFTITPSPDACNSSSGGGGGRSGGGGSGGGGGGGSGISTPTPTAIVTPTSNITSTPTLAPVAVSVVVKLYRKAGDPKVYKQNSDGSLEWIKTLEEFNAAGYKWSNIKQVTAKEFSKLQSTKTSPIKTLVKIKGGLAYLNVRNSGSLKGKLVGKAVPGEKYTFTQLSNGWYKIQKDSKDWGWVSGKYVTEI